MAETKLKTNNRKLIAERINKVTICLIVIWNLNTKLNLLQMILILQSVFRQRNFRAAGKIGGTENCKIFDEGK